VLHFLPQEINSSVSVPTHVNTFRTCGQPIQQRNISKPGHVPLNCIRKREYNSEREKYDRHIWADEKVCQMKILLILHEHEETGEAIWTE